MAYEILNGFGDELLGEWTEDRPQAFHVRRRLTEAEAQKIGDAVDLRGTDEGTERFEAIKWVLPVPAIAMALEELNDKPRCQ